MSKASDTIAARPRQLERVDIGKLIPGLVNHDGTAVLEAWIEIPRVATLEAAAMEAHAHVVKSAERAREGATTYQTDDEILSLAKQTALLWHAFRAGPDEGHDQLFPTADWMRSELTAGTHAALCNVYLEVEKRGPLMRPEITDETVEAFVALAAAGEGDALELELAGYDRGWLTSQLATVLRALAAERTPDDTAADTEPAPLTEAQRARADSALAALYRAEPAAEPEPQP